MLAHVVHETTKHGKERNGVSDHDTNCSYYLNNLSIIMSQAEATFPLRSKRVEVEGLFFWRWNIDDVYIDRVEFGVVWRKAGEWMREDSVLKIREDGAVGGTYYFVSKSRVDSQKKTLTRNLVR